MVPGYRRAHPHNEGEEEGHKSEVRAGHRGRFHDRGSVVTACPESTAPRDACQAKSALCGTGRGRRTE